MRSRVTQYSKPFAMGKRIPLGESFASGYSHGAIWRRKMSRKDTEQLVGAGMILNGKVLQLKRL